MEYGQVRDISSGYLERSAEDQQSILRRETEDYLRSLILDDYPKRQACFWKRDYSSLEAFLQSVEPNRQRWTVALGSFQPEGDFEPEEEPFLEDTKVKAFWVSIRFARHLRCRAILALPKKGKKTKLPLVIAQHGISSNPERVMGFLDGPNYYHAYGYQLAAAGYAVMAPQHLTGLERRRYQRLALLLGATLAGLEVSKLKRFLDYLGTRREVDPERIAMWGISLGGYYTLLSLPVEPRIKLGICCAFFNHRLEKMIVDDPRYSCFLSTEEEHIFIPGWLREFRDADLISLICPRPFLIQTGKADGVSWWPWVVREFQQAKTHYEKLGLADRFQLDLHSGGHEIRYESGLAFLKKWL
ncbi:MAG: hypothetical protein NC911_07415 [Candidatus Omnitrophica bacterium]|nr:hypothetical protein [Candidatus Omnitrophota bacterium]